ncbi:Uncharacterised protein [Mycobacteroides abscessus subsp. abscessus]|nr:Uncharacterised protein [Mycobacteroides abscessus subsp. abscessus]SKT75697.1 Uncharacterised protein [Mycobacteroides abscessus subsp. abscessus]SKV60084.1 Uncharacterised protein [Mycobacteroides abscessus subsp. abscessus]
MKPLVYRVSALGAVTSRKAALGYSRIRMSCPMGARGGSAFSTLVITRRVISMVTRA